VQWIVMVDEDAVSKPEIDAFHAKYAKNARPVQALHGRAVEIAP
jgi:carbonic anhydrase